MFLSWMLKDVDIDRLNVKHLEVYGKNTLTTPKIVLSDSVADPALNGEITRNGTTVKAFSEGAVKKFGGTIAEDVSGITQVENSDVNSNVLVLGKDIPETVYTTVATKAVTIAKANAVVVLFGYSTHMTDENNGRTLYIKILDVAVEVAAEQTISIIKQHCKTHVITKILTGVASGSHTYNLQIKQSGASSGTDSRTSCGIYVAVLELG